MPGQHPEYGGLSVSQDKRLKDLGRENARLRRAVSDLNLDRVILQEAAWELLSPSRPRLLAAQGYCAIATCSNCADTLSMRSATLRLYGSVPNTDALTVIVLLKVENVS